MRLRFRDIAPSGTTGFPFLAGQVIEVAELSPDMRAALEQGKAELLKDDEPELAIAAPPERAVTHRGKRAR